MIENEVEMKEEILAPEVTSEEVTLDERNETEDNNEPAPEEAPDYAALVEEDLEALRGAFPELRGIRNITELDNPLRYAALRDLGLTPREAYLATSERRYKRDNRSHIVSATPKRGAAPTGTMSTEELRAARSLFDGMSDAEIQSLYKKVTIR